MGKRIVMQKMENARNPKDMINPSFDDLMGDLSFEINDKDDSYIPHINYQNTIKEETVEDSKEEELKNIPAFSDRLKKDPLEINVTNIKKEVDDNDYEEHTQDKTNHDQSRSHERVFVKCEFDNEEEQASCESGNNAVKEEELIDDPVVSDTEADPLELTIRKKDIAGKESEVCVGAESDNIRTVIGSSDNICDSSGRIEKNGFATCREGVVVEKIDENKCSVPSSKDATKKKTKTTSVLKQLKCHYCDKYLSGYTSFKTHLRIHTGEKPYFCNCCNNSFRQYSDLQRHVRSHTGEKPFTCEFCKKSFNRSTNLKTHLRIHTGERPFSCEFCPKSFSEASNLKVHLRTHTGEKPFSCKFCDRTFGESGHFRHHIRTHTGEKPFTCHYCEKSFYQSTHLKNHVRTHTGERPFPCHLCQKSFTRASCLRNHLQRIHK